MRAEASDLLPVDSGGECVGVVKSEDSYLPQEVVAAAERVLSARLVGVEPVGFEPRAWIRRLKLEGEPGSVVMKRSLREWPFRPDDPGHSAPWGLYPDWVGAHFLSLMHAAPEVSPRFLGGDLSVGAFFLEDIGDGPNLCDMLRSTDQRTAVSMFEDYMYALARMHALTRGRQDALRELWVRSVGRDPVAVVDDVTGMVERVGVAFASLGVHRSGEMDSQLRSVAQRLDDPGPLAVFIHGDPCPDNCQVDQRGRLRLFDFQAARFGHAFIDAVYPLVPFPTCWCCRSVPAKVTDALMAVYRAELSASVPAIAEDEPFEEAVGDGLAWWALSEAAYAPEVMDRIERSESDRTHMGFVIAEVRVRLTHQISTFIHWSESTGRLGALADALGVVVRAVGADTHLDGYPVFAGGNFD